ncbi:MAG: protein phosphatase 2C domain-containing protein [Elusimicrobia bacterium]|nr:protein phosphatase 2C domain-containing protein [Elusimicrobiota bacterium]
MKITYFARTDVGRVRTENQDSFGFSKSDNLYFVCDGMGGGAAGDFASRCATSVIAYAFGHMAEKDTVKICGGYAENLTAYSMRPAAAIRLANRALYNFSDKYTKLSGMGTTVAAILIDDVEGIAHMYHVGDSRIYRFRNGRLETLTKDHSKINELIDEGKMTYGEVKSAEIQSMITRAIGTGPRVRIDYCKTIVRPDDCFILCSDGLNGEINDTDIAEIVSQNVNNPENIVKNLISSANAAGGKDNTTVIAVLATGKADIVSAEHRFNIDGGDNYDAVVTIPEETSAQLSCEDAQIKNIISAVRIKIPKSARETGLLNQPILLVVLFLVFLLIVGYVVTQQPRHVPSTALNDLSGAITGVQLFVRTPTAEQQTLFKNSGDDIIQKLQLLQDWQRESDRLTEPLENVQIVVLSNEKEEFKGISNADGAAIKVPRGTYWLTLRYPGYSIISEKIERRDTVAVTVESATALKPMTVIMLPAN